MTDLNTPGQPGHTQSSSAADPLGAFGLPAFAGAVRRDTVVNPERRSDGSSQSSSASIDRSSSELWNRLFPLLTADGASPLPSAGPEGIELGHFVLEERIGIGGMGAVFRALDTRLQRYVALKVLGPAQSHDVSAVKRFHNEARSAARLDHDNIARVFFIGEDKGLHFIAFEYITGVNLRDLIRQHGPLHPAEAINYTIQVATALGHTAAAGVVHRDIKPSNIIITPNGRAKLVDLGLARKLNTDSLGDITLAGTTLGTFDYISPEQAKDPRDVDVRSDIYSLGCTLYHMLTGSPPYPEGTVLQKLLDHQGKDPPDPAEKNRHVPAELSAVVRKMMASKPRNRYANPGELISDLVPLAQAFGLPGLPGDVLPWHALAPRQERFWERNLGWLATVGVLLLIVYAVDRFPEWHTPEAPREIATGPVGQPLQPTVVGEDPAPDTKAPGNPPAQASTTTVVDNAVVEKQTVERTVAEASTKPAESKVPLGPPFDEGLPIKRPFGLEPLMPLIAGDDTSETPPTPPTSRADAVTTVRPELPTEPEVPSPLAPAPASTVSEPPETAPPTVAASPAAEELRPFWVIRTDGTPPESKPTLEAACAAAKDGNIIEIRHDGRLPEPIRKPILIKDKKITIRAGEGVRPWLEFAGSSTGVGFASRTHMVELVEGSVELINLDVRLVSTPAIGSSWDWALVSLQGSGQVRLDGVSATVENAANANCAVVELLAGPVPTMPEMSMKKTGGEAGPEFEVELVNSFIRGGTDLFVIRHTRPGRINVERSAVAVDGALLLATGNLEMLDANAHIELRMSHVTGLVGDSLIRLDAGETPRDLLPVNVASARNSIFATNTTNPLVAVYGNTDAEDYERLLTWSGERNFYDGFNMFWAGTADEFLARDFEGWRRTWPKEVDPQNGQFHWRGMWDRMEFTTVRPQDLRLDHEFRGNPAISGATDGTDVGADLATLPDPPDPPMDLR